jgi:hypothetical protein
MKLNDLFPMNLLENFLNSADVPFSRYDAEEDQSVVKRTDTRKTRLTLRQIHLLRQMQDVHTFEKAKELENVQKIYKAPPEQGMV